MLKIFQHFAVLLKVGGVFYKTNIFHACKNVKIIGKIMQKTIEKILKSDINTTDKVLLPY